MARKRTFEELTAIALKYKTKGAFVKNNPAAYLAASRRDDYDKIVSHMPEHVDQSGENNSNAKWNFNNLKKEALKFNTKSDFQKESPAAYLAATRREDYSKIVSHMPGRMDIFGENNPHFKWTFDKLKKEAKKYATRGKFQDRNPSAYITARDRGVLDLICCHMPDRVDQSGENNPNFRWTKEELQGIALKYDTIADFQSMDGAAYQAAWGRDVLIEICSHIKKTSSGNETKIFDEISGFFPKAKKYMDRSVSIHRKSYIKGFEIDILIPELNKGIEYDGTYYHSYEFMRAQKGKRLWSNTDVRNYHSMKDSWFASKGIKILHIREEDWLFDRAFCISQIEEFLGITGFMSEYKQKAA